MTRLPGCSRLSRDREHAGAVPWDRTLGTGGKQIIADDPSGNPVELFEPTLSEARLG